MTLKDWARNTKYFSLTEEQKSRAIEQYIPDFEIFPSKASLNFITSSVQEARVYGSLMPETVVKIRVSRYKPPTEEELIHNFCTPCKASSVCPQGLNIVEQGLCIHDLKDVSVQHFEEVTVELPETVIARVRGVLYLYAYLPNRDIEFIPLTLFNVYSHGEVCWGKLRPPKTLRKAWNSFWSSVFNHELKTLFSEGDYISRENILSALPSEPTKIGNLLAGVRKEHVIPASDAGLVHPQNGNMPAELLGTSLYTIHNNVPWFVDIPSKRRFW